MWRMVPASTLKGNQRRYEDELLRALRVLTQQRVYREIFDVI